MTRLDQLKQRSKEEGEEGEEGQGGRGRGKGRGRGRGRGRSRGSTQVMKRPASASRQKAPPPDPDANWAAWGTDEGWEMAYEYGWENEEWAWDSYAWWEAEYGKYKLAEESNQVPGDSSHRNADGKRYRKSKKTKELPEQAKESMKKKKKNDKDEETGAAAEMLASAASAHSKKKRKEHGNEADRPARTEPKTNQKRKDGLESPSRAESKKRRSSKPVLSEQVKVHRSFPNTDYGIVEEIMAFVKAAGKVQDEQVRTELRSRLAEHKDCTLSVYWTRPAVGLRFKGTTKDVAYISMAVYSEPNTPKTFILGATLIVADLLAAR